VKRALFLLPLALASCGSRAGTLGLDEPIRVSGAQFVEGELPAAGDGPKVVTVESANNKIPQGFLGKAYAGNVGKGAWSIAFKLAGQGSGYWLVPVGFPDPISDVGELRWDAKLDLAPDAPLGKQTVQIEAFDESGRPGPRYEQDLEILSSVPAGRVVVMLKWDSAADLDLVVISPSGKVSDPKHPTTSVAPGGNADGVLDHDSNASCVRDGYQEEAMVFQQPPPAGTYEAYVRMFAGCGAPAANFTASLYVDGELKLSQSGRLLEQYDVANGGTNPPLRALRFTF
jgi:hypothetical protein